MGRTIRKIAPAIQPPKLLRVAAYVRVSMEKDSMLHSLSAQVSHYSTLIQRTLGWTYAGVYADKALTGTKGERPEFQRLLADCRVGQIDMVLTKSISRFARNTVTLLESVRELKALGVDIFFEEQNIHSTSGDGELMLTILASYAQEESRSVSENCKWRIRKRFEAGDPATWRNLYGYCICKGEVSINPEEAAIVRRVFHDYLSGVGSTEIARALREEGIPNAFGGAWTPTRVLMMLKNEKYSGNALLQKEYTTDHLTKRRKRNQGELPMYYAENTHPAIISLEDFMVVQQRIEQNRQRSNISNSFGKRSALTGKIVCDKCGKHYRRKTSHGGPVWNCSTCLRFGKAYCHTKQIPEDILMATAASVLGCAVFDEALFHEKISEIRVPAFNHLVFIFKDGAQVERVWQDKSRADSWTDEMRVQAANHVRRRFAK